MKEKSELQLKYEPLIEEIMYDDLKNKGLHESMPVSKAYVVNYLGNEPENQAEFLLNVLVDNNICFMVEIDPYKLYEKIYYVKDKGDIIAIFKDNVLDCDLLDEIFGETYEQVCLENYI